MANYKIADIEGIGPKYASKLQKTGVRSVSALLKAGATKKGRKALAEASGIDESSILKWVNMSDLYRVNGVGSEYAELLERAGVDTVKELRNRNPENLHAKMKEVNDKSKLVRQLPGSGQVRKWVDAAKRLDPMVTY